MCRVPDFNLEKVSEAYSCRQMQWQTQDWDSNPHSNASKMWSDRVKNYIKAFKRKKKTSRGERQRCRKMCPNTFTLAEWHRCWLTATSIVSDVGVALLLQKKELIVLLASGGRCRCRTPCGPGLLFDCQPLIPQWGLLSARVLSHLLCSLTSKKHFLEIFFFTLTL